METRDIETFYNSSLQKSHNKYEFDRWFKTSQSRASYHATKYALHTYCLPLIKQGSHILEVGPGPGTWTKEILNSLPEVRVSILDISEQMLRQAKENITDTHRVTFMHHDFTTFVPDKQYDFFFSSRFFEYVPDKQSVIETISKSLAEGGKGYLVTKTPQYKRAFSKRVSGDIHQGQISSDELVRLMERSGLKVIKIVNVTSVFPGLRNGLFDKVLTFVSRFIPYKISKIVSESYAVIFEK